MLRAMLLSISVLALSVSSAFAEANPDPNAALKYWQGFAQLNKLAEPEIQKVGNESLTMPLDASARDLVTRAEYALRMMHRGSALPYCNWGISYEDGIEVLLPHLGAARTLAFLAALRARIRFEDGHIADAVDDVVAAIAMGRHSSTDGSLISVLVGYAIENLMGETLALFIPKMSPGMIKNLKARLVALPPRGSPATATLNCEASTLDWFIQQVKATKGKDGLMALMVPMLTNESQKDTDATEKARTFIDECGGNAAGVIKFAEEMRPVYPILAKMLELPLEQFDKELERDAKKRSGNPVYNVFIPALGKVRLSQAKADVRRALLEAALDVQLEGRDSLKNHPDPIVGGTFDYVAFEGGFELRSKFKPDDKPFSLTVGIRKN